MKLSAFNSRLRVAPSVRLVCPRARADPRVEPETASQSSAAPFVEAELDGDPGKVIHMEASKFHTRGIEEAEKPISTPFPSTRSPNETLSRTRSTCVSSRALEGCMGPILPSWVQSLSPVDLEHDMALYMLAGEYMTLPASQYSVLDGAKVERLTDDTFRVSVSAFAFFNFTIEPILTVCVQPTDTGCRIELLACKLAGSKIIESQNSKFSARMVNNVMWRPSPDRDNGKELVSDVVVSMDVVKPGWFVLPNAAVKTAGNTVISGILAAAVPRFLAQLEKDYKAWAAGDDSRQALGSGEML